MIKIAFFDIDGTLRSFKTHTMSESTRRALAQMHQNGIVLVISTGRNFNTVPEEFRTGFDAYITYNGQYCLVDSGAAREVYRDVLISPEDVAAIVAQVDAGLYEVTTELDGVYFVSRFSERVLEARRRIGSTYGEGDIHRVLNTPVHQFCAFLAPGEERIITEAAPGVTTTRWNELFCDVIPQGGGKDKGVAATLERFGFASEEAIAFGDGENDVSMFGACGTSVAMGSAWESVKAQASYVTDAVDDDGIWNAAVHFGLI